MASIGTLVDAFNQASLNATLWTSSTGGSAALSYASGGATETFPASTTSSSYAYIGSQADYDLTSSQAAIHVTATPSGSAVYVYFQLLASAGNLLEWYLSNGSLYARYEVSSAVTTLATLTYSAVTHAYWRIREASGTTYWDTSPDGVNWTQQASVADPVTETAVYAYIGVGATTTASSPGHLTFSDFNIGRPAGADTGSGTDTGTLATALAGADTGSGADTGTVAAAVAGTDTGSGADTGSLAAALSGTDTAAGADTGSVAAAVSGADTGAGADTAGLAVSGSDTASGADTASVAVAVSGADTAAGADSGSLAAAVAGSDTGSGAGTASAAAVVIYYVSPAGDDSNDGMSPSTPWQTIGKVNGTTLAAGDTVLFLGGMIFDDATLYLTVPGTGGSPVTIGSYGTGLATLAYTGGDCVYAYDCGGIVIQDLICPAATGYNGIEFYNDTDAQLAAIEVTGCTASGQYGILIGGATTGYDGITLDGDDTSASIYAGVLTYCQADFDPDSPAYAHSSVLVSGCTSDDCPGDASITGQWTGSGIVLGSVDGGTITLCESSGCGADNGCTTDGPAGIWCYASDNVTIQLSLVHGQLSGTSADGDGFDLDVDCTNCTVQYNLAYSCDGAGVLAFGGSDTGWAGNTVRYNLCWGNGRGNDDYGDLTLSGNTGTLEAYGNTLVSQDNGDQHPSPLTTQSADVSSVRIFNNIFCQRGSGPVINAYAAYDPADLWLAGNSYYPVGNGIDWGGTTYIGLAAWRAAAYQEVLGNRALGQDLDPGLAAPDTEPAVSSPASFAGAAGMKLTAASKLAGRGLDLDGMFGIDPGSQDAFGNAASVPLWVGAYQGTPQPAPLFGLRYELLLGDYWTDVSDFVYERTDQAGNRGHQDESTTTNPSTLAPLFDNRDARFSSTSPAGAYYPYIGRNTQLRQSVPEGASYLRLETDAVSYAQCPDSAAISLTGNQEVLLDVTLDNWRADQILACKWADTGTELSWLLLLNEDGYLSYEWWDGTNIRTATSDVMVPVPGLRRQTLSVKLADYTTGTVYFYTAPAIGGSYTQLGDAIVAGSSAGVVDSTAPVQVGYGTDTGTGYAGVNGKIHEFILKDGSGTIWADAQFYAVAEGATSFSDGYSNTWTMEGTAEISARRYRAHVEVSGWPQEWDLTGADVWVSVAGAGILQRLSQGAADRPLQSAFRRALPNATGLKGYWPCEDGNDQTGAGATPAKPTQFASAVPGGTAGHFTGSPQFASSSTFLCSYPLPTFSKSRWHFPLPSGSAQDTANVFRFLVQVPSGGDTDGGTLARMFSAGDIGQVDLVYNTAGSGSLRLLGYDWATSGTPVFDTGVMNLGVDGLALWMSVELVPNGSGVKWRLAYMQLGAAASVNVASGTVASSSIGNGQQLVLNALNFTGGENMDGTAAGQVTYQGTYETLDDFAAQLNAWIGETAGNRFSRLCGEQGIPFRWRGSLDDTVAMGAQTPLALTDLLQECVDADRGQMWEPRMAFALGYRTRASMQNQAAGVTIDYSLAQLAADPPPATTEDDQNTVNDAIVTNSYTGGSGEVAVTEGPLSVSDPPDGVGYYQQSPQINLASDTQCVQLAGWITWLGTVNEPRYPALAVNLARAENAALYDDLQELDLGDRLAIVNTPPWLPPDGISQIVQAIAEVRNSFVSTITWTGVPESPYETGVVGDEVYGRVDTDGSQLHAAITATATSIEVDTLDGAPTVYWTTDPDDFPFDVNIGGERITVTDISGSSNPQVFTVTRSVNGVVKPHAAGEDVRLYYPTIVSL